jgi:hypothetical protein
MTEKDLKRRVKLEREYLSFERSKNRDDIRLLTSHHIFSEELRKAIKKPRVPVKFTSEGKAVGGDEYIFVTSDFHYNGDESLLSHLGTVYAHIINKQKEHGFKRIKLLELGDTIDGGSLRPSQLMAIKKGMVFQIVDVSKVYADLIHKLSKKMHVDFYCVTSSNHTQIRPLGTDRNELVEEDLMHVFYHYIKESVKTNMRVRVWGGDDLMVPVTPKHMMFVAHGHLIGNKKEGYLQELAYNRGVQFDYGLFGHFHHYREVTLYKGRGCNKKVFYAPSMSTVESSYEKDRNMSSKAGMLMIVFNSEKGHRYSEELFIE